MTRLGGLMLGGLLALASPAPAQMPLTLGGPARPPVSSKEFEKFVEVLALDDAQAEVARSLFQTMLSDYEAIRSAMSQQMDDLQAEYEETRDPGVLGDMMPVQERANRKTSELEDRFMSDLRMVINDDQAGRWDSLERMRRREKTLGGGVGVSGAGVDLIKIVDELGLPEATRGELADPLGRYEIDLDRALVDRNRLKNEQEARFREAQHPGEGGAMTFDFASFQESAAQMREAELKLREVNQRYAAQLGGMLDEATRALFDRAVREASFPQVYRRSYTGRAFDRAADFDDLTDEQRTQLDSFREQYERELAAVNDRWAAAEAEAEGEGPSNRMTLGGGSMIIQVGDDVAPDSPVAEARNARKELDEKYYDRVKQLMTPEQAERLPRKRQSAPGGFTSDAFEGDMAVFVTQDIVTPDEDDSDGQ